MSWYIKKVGKAANVKAAVLAEANVPDAIKQHIGQMCDAAGQQGVFVEGASHYSATDNYPSVTHFKFECVHLAPDVPVEAQPPAAQSPS